MLPAGSHCPTDYVWCVGGEGGVGEGGSRAAHAHAAHLVHAALKGVTMARAPSSSPPRAFKCYVTAVSHPSKPRGSHMAYLTK